MYYLWFIINHQIKSIKMITSISANSKFIISTGELITVEKMEYNLDLGMLVSFSIGKSDTIFRDSYNDALEFLNDEKAISIN